MSRGNRGGGIGTRRRSQSGPDRRQQGQGDPDRVRANRQIQEVRPAAAGPSGILRGNVRDENHRQNYRCSQRRDNRDAEKRHQQDGKATEPREEQDAHSITYRRLQELAEKDPAEVLLTLNLEKMGFFALLTSSHLMTKYNFIALVLKVLGVACDCDYGGNVGEFVTKVITRGQTFLTAHVTTFLAEIEKVGSSEYIETLPHLINFLNKAHDTIPNASYATIKVILIVLNDTLEVLNRKNISERCLHLLDQCKDINKKLEEFSKETQQSSIAETQKAINMERHQMRTPPNNFRGVPIFPEAEDIHIDDRPFLRRNIIEGHYMDTDHYLDVQFRLLREDYIRPLREGILEYRHITETDEGVKAHNKAVFRRVYTNVRVIGVVLDHRGLRHRIHFSINKLKHVRWESSKRLMNGSLLCLSSDNFETMLFATVAERKLEDIKNGFLEIQFPNLDIETMNLPPDTSYVMVESEAYFEAYRYNLITLQNINDGNLPMKDYIVHVKTDVQRPSYISEDICRTLQEMKECQQTKMPRYRGTSKKWLFDLVKSFDESQMAAFEAAMTKEFAIIQGPPGTGKTFIGLKIVEALLQSCTYWNDQHFPILLVCYTNHALDQFLEGISQFTDSIVRIGGRCQVDSLKRFALGELRHNLKVNRKVFSHVHDSISDSWCSLKTLHNEAHYIERAIERSRTALLSVSELRDVIKKVTPQLSLQFRRSSMEVWLCVFGMEEVDDASSITSQDVTDFLAGLDEDVNVSGSVNNLTEIDNGIEYLEEMRLIDEDYEDHERLEFNRIRSRMRNKVKVRQMKNGEGWKVQGGRKKMKKFIRNHLQNEDKMDENEAGRVRDINRLSSDNRWRLYRYWLDNYIKMKQTQLTDVQKKYLEQVNIYQELRKEEDINVAGNAKIIGMTTTGAAKYRHIITRIKPVVLVVEEAAEVLEAHIVTSLTKDTKHVILIGDHLQLRPMPNVYQLAKTFNLEISLFERMIKNGMEYFPLTIQHRMRPCISSLLTPAIYPVLNNHDSVNLFEHVKGVEKDMFFISHRIPEETDREVASYSNRHEAEFVVELCRYLILQGYETSQITILTPYAGQLFKIKELLKKMPECKDVRATVVDNFQGEENDIILLSFVRSNFDGKAGFLKIENRVCVSLSRAKMGMFCIGNFEFFLETSPLWKEIICILKDQNAIGINLTLACRNHPQTKHMVQSGKDIREKAPEGGCLELCDFRLPCGHVCAKLCHVYDSKHEEIKCQKKCVKSCDMGHNCSFTCHFGKDCPPCNIRVLKRRSCGHDNLVPCHKEADDMDCEKQCEKLLSCGHACTKLCGKPCMTVCSIPVKTIGPCKHEIEVYCFELKRPQEQNENPFVKRCKEACNTVLPCGHLCKGSCSSCYQKRMHVPCEVKCGRELVCGHICNATCARGCPPCEKPCKNRCVHGKCRNKCGLSCVPCMKKCPWKCEHYKCTKLCHEPCDRPPCNEPCKKKLKCGHQCIGLCGGPCPKKCRECDKDEVTEIFFGTEEKEDARFIRLEDCQHIFEVNSLTTWLEEGTSSSVELRLCPRCKTPIRKNVRFGNAIRKSIDRIEKVKKKTIGPTEDIEKRKKLVLKWLKNVHNEVCHFETILVDLIGRFVRACMKKIGIDIFLSMLTKTLSDQRTVITLNLLILYENLLEFVIRFAKILEMVKQNNVTLTSAVRDRISYRKYNIIPLAFNSEQSNNDLIQSVSSYDRIPLEEFDFLMTCMKDIVEYLSRHLTSLSNGQHLEDVNNEVIRLEMLAKAIDWKNEYRSSINISKAMFNYKCAIDCVTKLSPLTDMDKTLFKENLTEANRLVEGGLGISDIERKEILKAMNLLPGHWFECPNGHVYCITECGGAMEEGRCSECGATVDGGSRS